MPDGSGSTVRTLAQFPRPGGIGAQGRSLAQGIRPTVNQQVLRQRLAQQRRRQTGGLPQIPRPPVRPPFALRRPLV